MNLAAAATTGFDPIAMEVFSNRLLALADEMSNTLIRSSFSTNIKERRDCSVALFDARGRLIAQASNIPIHLGSLCGSVAAVREIFAEHEIEDGDAFVSNDAYLAGGTHAPDISIVTPVFVQGRLAFYTANIGHHTDVGGSVPGSLSHTASSVFEEGLRIPVIKLARRGAIDSRLLDLIAHNSRDPVERQLDLGVQVATNQRGGALLQTLSTRHSLDEVLRSVDDLLAYTERRLRLRIAALAPGCYRGEAWLDNDGIGTEPLPIRVAVTVEGDALVFDFAGSGAQARGALNIPLSAMQATCYYAVKALLDPELPPNSGMFAPIELRLPEASIVNPRFPAPVGGRSGTCQRVARAIFQALAELVPPARRMAASCDTNSALTLSGLRPNSGRRFVYLETIGGGAGARRDADGMHAVQVHITNTSNLPTEALEQEYPLLVREYALVPDSGGDGAQRGGCGIAREIEALADGVRVSVRTDGAVMTAPGMQGAGSARGARVLWNPGLPDAAVVASRLSDRPLPRGARIRLETPGGGGFGAAHERLADAVAQDVRDGIVTAPGHRPTGGPAPMPGACA